MSSTAEILAVALADFRERTRRYSFLLTLLFAVFLGYATATGKVFLQLDEYRGVYTSGWIGTLVAMVITCFVSLVGFYVVKNAVERDRTTGVGQILAGTPLAKLAYASGKFFSNFAVLSSMVVVLAIAALLMQFIAAEDPRVDLWALLSPFLLIALPAMAITAAIALCFEMISFLRGGFGNVAWFFVWTFMLSLPLLAGKHSMDAFGLLAVMDSLTVEGLRHVPGYHGGLAFQISTGQQVKVAQELRWAGIHWTALSISARLASFGVAACLTFLASLLFDRFDSCKSAAGTTAQPALAKPAAANPPSVVASVPPARVTPLATAPANGAFARVFVAELRLAFQGLRWWWYVVAAGLVLAQLASPLSVSRGPLLGFAWLWPILLWSALGSREVKHDVRRFLFSCPRIVPRQFFASWSAGLAVSLVTSAGVVLRLLIARQSNDLLTLLAGAIFVPSLALAAGVVSGSSKFFEGLYAVLWYVGPMNHTPTLDYTGAADQAHPAVFAAKFLGLAIAFLAVAYSFRSRQLRAN